MWTLETLIDKDCIEIESGWVMCGFYVSAHLPYKPGAGFWYDCWSELSFRPHPYYYGGLHAANAPHWWHICFWKDLFISYCPLQVIDLLGPYFGGPMSTYNNHMKSHTMVWHGPWSGMHSGHVTFYSIQDTYLRVYHVSLFLSVSGKTVLLSFNAQLYTPL